MSRSVRRPGFTLIELLIVVVIIGILAAIAIPRFQYSKGKAYLASMKSDLRNLASAEESYFYEHQTYTTDTLELEFKHSSGVVLDIQTGNATAWAALATHPAAYPMRCALYMGNSPLAPASSEGQVGCDGF